ncbi:MAG: YitT family protein [Bacilli bacterium]|nr:YitT family protein [Bacilli bacterium]
MALSKDNKLINFLIKHKKDIKHILLCVLGSFVLAFGTAVFLEPAQVVAGGVSGIGIIINHYLESVVGFNVVDIVVWSLNIILFVVSFIFIGKKFTFNTLIATFTFPAFLSLIIHTGMFDSIIEYFDITIKANDPDLVLLLAGIFGGLFVGLGVAITFIGEGSTGGLDVLCFICYKFLHIKVSITSFVFDGRIIFTCAFAIPEHVMPAFIGVLSALLSAIVIDILYVRSNNACIIDIISARYQDINKYIVDVLGRTSTIIDVEGGFTKKKYRLVRFVVDKRSLPEVKEEIAKIDKDAFITIASATHVFGEGFVPIKIKNQKKHKDE